MKTKNRLPLSEREDQVLAIVTKTIKATGFAPTRQEIADKLGFKANLNGKAYVNNILARLEKKGAIKLGAGWRNIKIIN